MGVSMVCLSVLSSQCQEPCEALQNVCQLGSSVELSVGVTKAGRVTKTGHLMAVAGVVPRTLAATGNRAGGTPMTKLAVAGVVAAGKVRMGQQETALDC